MALRLSCSVWHVDPPRPGIKPVSPASADSLFAAGSPGKPCVYFNHSALKLF